MTWNGNPNAQIGGAGQQQPHVVVQQGHNYYDTFLLAYIAAMNARAVQQAQEFELQRRRELWAANVAEDLRWANPRMSPGQARQLAWEYVLDAEATRRAQAIQWMKDHPEAGRPRHCTRAIVWFFATIPVLFVAYFAIGIPLHGLIAAYPTFLLEPVLIPVWCTIGAIIGYKRDQRRWMRGE